MKIQLVILSVLLLSVYAHPVPDEEVSPVHQAAAVPEVKSDVVAKPVEGDVVPKSEGRAAEEPSLKAEKPAESAAPKVETKSTADLPAEESKLSAAIKPSADLTKTIATKLPAEAAAPAEFLDEKKEEPKSLPLASAPKVEETKPALPAEEAKSADIPKPVQIVEAKSAVEESEKKPEERLSEKTPLKAEKTAEIAPVAPASPAVAIAEKKDETAGRQVRGTGDKTGAAVSEVKSLPIDSTAVAGSIPESADSKSEEKPIVPELKAAASAPAPEKSAAPEKPAEERKSEGPAPALPESEAIVLPSAKLDEPKSAAAEPAPASIPEAKKIEESAAPAPAAAASLGGASAEEGKKLESAKKPEIAKSSEVSKESDESKESEESKEQKSA